MKTRFQTDGKFAFIDGWVKILNYAKYNQYTGESNIKALDKELNDVPLNVKEYTPDTLPTGGAECPDTLNNHKSIIRNQKSIINNQKSVETYKEIISHYNSTFGKQTKSYASWKTNCDFWLQTYTLDDIKKAMDNCKKYGWWANDPDIDLFFRTKNKAGQPVDYINQLLNLKNALRDSKNSDDPLVKISRKALGYDN